MKRAMDNSQLQDVIKHASDMLYELRTGRLSPQNYYDLYISVTDELRHLESFLEEVLLCNNADIFLTLTCTSTYLPLGTFKRCREVTPL